MLEIYYNCVQTLHVNCYRKGFLQKMGIKCSNLKAQLDDTHLMTEVAFCNVMHGKLVLSQK